MQISVVVPTFNRRDIVLRTVKTLFDQNCPPTHYEIVVVVDGSTDGTAEALRELKPNCRFRIIEQENRGLASARNTGFRAAESELVIFLDDDMLCDPTLVREHCAAHQDSKAAIGFGAIFLSPDSPRSLAAECFNREVGSYYLQHKKAPDIPWPRSACIFGNTSVPRRLLMESGGFDEGFRMREDAELGERLFAGGVAAKYVSRAIARQFYTKSAADLMRDAEAFAVADVMFARKHPERLGDTFLGRIASGPGWKTSIRRMAAVSPRLADAVLAPACWLGEAFLRVPVARNIGVRALQIRRGIHWFHKVLEVNRDSTPGL